MASAAERQDGVLRILDAAEGCFGARGYARSSMADIARNAGVAKSLLHYHFHSKATMFLAVQMRMFEGLMGEVKGAVQDGAMTQDRLRMAMYQVFDDLASDRKRARLLLELHAWEEEEKQEQLRQFTRKLRAMLVEGIGELVGSDGLVPGVTPEGLADVVLITFRGILVELVLLEEDGCVSDTRRAFGQSITLMEGALVGVS